MSNKLTGEGVMMEWFKKFFAFGALVFHRVCACVVQMTICASEVCARCFRENDFVKSTRPGGDYSHRGRRQSTRLLCSLLLVVSLVQLLPRAQWSETLRQGALTRFDPRIELQRQKAISYTSCKIFNLTF